MKLRITFCLFVLALGIAACSKQSDLPPVREAGFSSYLEECFTHAMAHTKGSTDLYLLEAEKIGSINDDSDIEQTVRRILSPNACIIADIANGEYVITSIGDSRMDIGRLDTLVREKALAGMDIYELTWTYKGREYTSMAIASDDDGVRYDNIGYRALSFVERPLYFSPEELLRGNNDSTGFDPGSDPLDTLATDSESEGSSTGSFAKREFCTDRFNRNHGEVLLVYAALYDGWAISHIETTVTITHAENDLWNIHAGFNTFEGGKGSGLVSFAWYYAHGSTCAPATATQNGPYLLPQGALGATDVCTINGPGRYR